MNAMRTCFFVIGAAALFVAQGCNSNETPTETAGCSLVSSTFLDIPATLSSSDSRAGRFSSTALSLSNGCATRKATYVLSSANPAVATVVPTVGSTPTDSAGVYVAPITVVAVGPGTTTLTGAITLSDGQTLTGSLAVTVVRAQGSLNVSITGLPLTALANVEVTQGTTLAGRLTASSTLILLSPGAYTVKASSVTSSDGAVYDATPATQQATVVNLTTTTATVAYARK